MDKELTREIIASGSAALRDFAQAAKTTAEHLYGVLVRQQIVEGISILVGLLVFTIIMFITTPKLWKWARDGHRKARYDGEFYFVGFGAFVAGIAIITAIGVTVLTAGIGRLLNPEYYAIKFIFDSVIQR